MVVKEVISDMVYNIDIIVQRMKKLGYKRRLIKKGLVIGDIKYTL